MEERPIEETAPKKEDPPLPEKPTPEQIEEAERLLQQASLARIRGQGSVSERFLKEAAEKAPGSAAVQAALGDELWKRSQFSRAREAYKMAHRIEPGNVTYETKWAESIVGSGGDPLSALNAASNTYASARSAGCLSMILPGLGQIVTGETTKGVTIMAVYLGAWTWAVFTPNGLSGIPALLGRASDVNVKEFNGVVFIPLLIVVATWIGSIASINARAKLMEPRKIERPIPPGEGNFEP